MLKSCDWPANDPLLIEYHDTEWGVPVYDDRKLFEMFILEGAQAGLSWYTILRKRENLAKFKIFHIVLSFNKILKYVDQIFKTNDGVFR